jgi:hypothetical protein
MCGHRQHTSRQEASEPRDRSVRASDADRDRTADLLRDEAASGRLTPEELDERLERAFTAKTLADLDELASDLPPREEARPRPARRPAVLLPMRGALLLVIVALAAVSVAVGHPVIWFALPLLFLLKARWMYAPRWR